MNNLIQILLIAALDMTGVADHSEICPSFVESPSQEVVVPDGWELVKPASNKLYLQGVSFSSGNPKNRAIIKYDKTERNGENRKDYYSHLTGKGDEDFWVSCSYLGTNLSITRKINYSKCIVTSSPLGYVQDVNCIP